MRPEEELAEFRRTHPPQTKILDGVRWEYILGGSGEDTMLVLPGALGIAESSFRFVRHLEPDFRVLSVTYPPLPAMAPLVDGLASLLEELDLAPAHVYGGSYGGLVAQVLVRRHPEKVQSLILSFTGVPDPRTGRSIELFVRLASVLPTGILRRLVARGFRRAMADDAFRWAYFNEKLATLSRADLLARYRVAADFSLNHRFAPEDLGELPGKVLISRRDEDPLVKRSYQEALGLLYPDAVFHTFPGEGHGVSAEEEVDMVRTFLLGEQEHRWRQRGREEARSDGERGR